MEREFLTTLKNIELLLREQNLQKKEVLTFDEACSYLGISESHLYKLTSAREIPFSKPKGKKLYFDREQLNKWMLSDSISETHEIERLASTFMVVNS
jgi:excisionase family DNA binding protein